MKPFGKALLLGATALLICGLVACNSSEPEETEPATQTKIETETEAVAGTVVETGTETTIVTETVTETAVETVVESESEVDSAEETDLTVETNIETNLVTETSVVTETVTETETETEPEVGGEAMTETETETETEVEETETEDPYAIYEKTSGLLNLYSETPTSSIATIITGDTTFGTALTIAEDCYLKTFSVYTYSWNDNVGEMQICFWRWNKDYATTTAAEPVFTYTVKDTPDNSWVHVNLPANTVGSGEWLYEFRNGSENSIGISVEQGKFDTGTDDVIVGTGYRSGRNARNYSAKVYVTYDRYDTSKLVEAPDAAEYTQITEGKAHVILLAGDSNASGYAQSSLLGNSVSAAKLARYNAGYSNVLINYVSDSNASGSFVPVQLGQGHNASMFGPEVGLADYLSRAYPGETFYIVKYTATGASLFQSWQDGGGAYYFFGEHVKAAMKLLEKQGLEPEIFAMCWLQGEVDSKTEENATFYGDREFALFNYIGEDFSKYMAEGGMAILDAAIYECPENDWSPLLNFYKRDFARLSQNYYYIDTNVRDIDGRDENNDPTHYDSDDMIELGELFGKGIARVLANAGYTAN